MDEEARQGFFGASGSLKTRVGARSSSPTSSRMADLAPTSGATRSSNERGSRQDANSLS
jgi:hypothetical protein